MNMLDKNSQIIDSRLCCQSCGREDRVNLLNCFTNWPYCCQRPMAVTWIKSKSRLDLAINSAIANGRFCLELFIAIPQFSSWQFFWRNEESDCPLGLNCSSKISVDKGNNTSCTNFGQCLEQHIESEGQPYEILLVE